MKESFQRYGRNNAYRPLYKFDTMAKMERLISTGLERHLEDESPGFSKNQLASGHRSTINAVGKF